MAKALHTRAAPADPDAPVVEAQLVDPMTGRPIAQTDTMTFAQWCVVDPTLAEADKAAYDEFYKPAVDAPTKEPVEPPPGSAFATYYGPSSEQKMDRATLDLRIGSMKKTLEGGGGGEVGAEGSPVVVDAPFVSQTANVLNCTMGNWTNEPTSRVYQWKRDGVNIGTNSPNYTVTAADVGKTFVCDQTARNAAGSSPPVTSNSVVAA